jgi:hypothetical protein
MQLACSRCSPIRISCGEYPRIRLTRELASSVNFILGTIPPVREIVIVISDLYLAPAPSGRSPSLAQGQLDSLPGTPATGAFPGIEHVARFGGRTALEGGWRPWLARWLGRGDLANVAPGVIAAVGVVPPPAGTSPAAGVASAAAAGVVPAAAERPSDSTAWIATPVHLIAGLTSLHLDRRSILRLPPADLESFAQDFNRTFGDSALRLTPLAAGDFLMQGPATLTAATTEPARALVADLEASLPKGNDAKALKRLGAELEMWLHAHPLNETRRRRGELPVSTLWLWGGTPAQAGQTPVLAAGASASARQTPVLAAGAPASAGRTPVLAGGDSASAGHTPSLAGGTPAPAAGAHAATPPSQQLSSPPASSNTHTTLAFGDDPYLAGLWRLHGDQTHSLPDQLTDLLTDSRPQRAVLVTEVTSMLHLNPHWTVLEALAEIDRRFVSPAITALGEGGIETVVLIANDTQWRVRRRDRLKLWRRLRPGISALS